MLKVTQWRHCVCEIWTGFGQCSTLLDSLCWLTCIDLLMHPEHCTKAVCVYIPSVGWLVGWVVSWCFEPSEPQRNYIKVEFWFLAVLAGVQIQAGFYLFCSFMFFGLMAIINWLIILPLSGRSDKQKKDCVWVFSKTSWTQKCLECMLTLHGLVGHSSPSLWLGRRMLRLREGEFYAVSTHRSSCSRC